MFSFVIAIVTISAAIAFSPRSGRSQSNSIRMSFDPKLEAGVSGPLGFFDPVGLSPKTKRDFSKFREAELKHGRVAMIAVLGILVGESGLTFFKDEISGPAIFQ